MANPLPAAFSASMKGLLDDEYPAFERSFEEKPPVSMRWNSRKSASLPKRPVPWCPTAEYLEERVSFGREPLWHAGAYYVQEASSMFLHQVFKHVAAANRPLRVLDACAAPGGKSTHIADLLPADSLLVSNEAIRSRLPVLEENMTRWGHDMVMITNNDPQAFASLEGYFDVIMIDAPCSGEGLFRKDPTARRMWSQKHVAHCAQRQRRILKAVWPALAENGLLIYSTCTYNTIENEENLQWLSQSSSLRSEAVRMDPSWGIRETESRGLTGYRFYPHRVRGEGLFLAVIRKLEHANPVQSLAKATAEPPARVLDAMKPWLAEPERLYFFYSDKKTISAAPIQMRNALSFLSNRLRIARAGVPIAEVKQNKLIPQQALATSVLQNKDIPGVDLDRNAAIAYLRKESVVVPASVRGFMLARHDGYSLGWLNCLDSRVNNLYPKTWRIKTTRQS